MAEGCLPHRALREMPSPGKSGSVFFLSDDDRFLIKTVSHEEMLLLLKLIPAYYVHCAENPTTLLTRFFGVHRIKPLGSQSKVRLLCGGSEPPLVHGLSPAQTCSRCCLLCREPEGQGKCCSAMLGALCPQTLHEQILFTPRK
jgi:hypothetical protein